MANCQDDLSKIASDHRKIWIQSVDTKNFLMSNITRLSPAIFVKNPQSYEELSLKKEFSQENGYYIKSLEHGTYLRADHPPNLVYWQGTQFEGPESWEILTFEHIDDENFKIRSNFPGKYYLRELDGEVKFVRTKEEGGLFKVLLKLDNELIEVNKHRELTSNNSNVETIVASAHSTNKPYTGMFMENNKVGVYAGMAHADAHVKLAPGIEIVTAKGSALGSKADATIDSNGLRADATAHVAKASVNIPNTPLEVGGSVGEVNFRAGVDKNYMGGEVGASLAELEAGPFGIRAGFKFGAHIKNGVPGIDAGPVSCCLM